MVELDCRDLPCPQPVIRTKEALESLPEGAELRVKLSSEASVKNVVRFAESQGHTVEVSAEGGEFQVKIIKRGCGVEAEGITCERPEGFYRVVVFDSDRMGEGDEELGRKILVNFIRTLREISPRPQALIFYNRGVFLAVEGSPVLEDLQALAKEGVEVLVCWTCLSHYGLEERLQVGQASNMYEILSRLMRASLVLRP